MSLLEEEIRTQTHTEGRPCKDTDRRRLVYKPRRETSEETNSLAVNGVSFVISKDLTLDQGPRLDHSRAFVPQSFIKV